MRGGSGAIRSCMAFLLILSLVFCFAPAFYFSCVNIGNPPRHENAGTGMNTNILITALESVDVRRDSTQRGSMQPQPSKAMLLIFFGVFYLVGAPFSAQLFKRWISKASASVLKPSAILSITIGGRAPPPALILS